MATTTQELSDSEREALVVALLCVNHFSLEAGWNLRAELRSEGLTCPRTASQLGIAAVSAALERAGYRRGRINEIVAPRVVALMQAIDEGKFADLPRLLAARNEGAFHTLVQTIWGFGPTSAANAWLLLAPSRLP